MLSLRCFARLLQWHNTGWMLRLAAEQSQFGFSVDLCVQAGCLLALACSAASSIATLRAHSSRLVCRYTRSPRFGRLHRHQALAPGRVRPVLDSLPHLASQLLLQHHSRAKRIQPDCSRDEPRQNTWFFTYGLQTQCCRRVHARCA